MPGATLAPRRRRAVRVAAPVLVGVLAVGGLAGCGSDPTAAAQAPALTDALTAVDDAAVAGDDAALDKALTRLRTVASEAVDAGTLDEGAADEVLSAADALAKAAGLTDDTDESEDTEDTDAEPTDEPTTEDPSEEATEEADEAGEDDAEETSTTGTTSGSGKGKGKSKGKAKGKKKGKKK